MKKRERTPQEKKRLSLKKDRRNAYGENDKASRKIIPRQRKASDRKYRQRLKDDLRKAPVEFGVVESARAVKGRKSSSRKVPDVPLSERIAHKLEWRQRRAARKHRH